MTDKDIWILAESRNGKVLDISYELLTRALHLSSQNGGKVHAMMIGESFSEEELNLLIRHGADSVVAMEGACLKDFTVAGYSECMLYMINRFRPQVLIAGATLTGRTLLPYTAMKCGTGLTADCTLLEIEEKTGLLIQTRPAIGGNIMASIQCRTKRPQMATVRPHSTCKALCCPERTGDIIRLAVPEGVMKESPVRVLSFQTDKMGTGIQDAEKVIVVGRGIKKTETLSMIRELAGLLGASIGASREVVDRGWLDYPHQVGLSGRTITPKLYIGIGVSGAIQHLAGMQTAETIIAVNKDPEAQIFQVADFGICGDLFDIVPAMIQSLRKGDATC